MEQVFQTIYCDQNKNYANCHWLLVKITCRKGKKIYSFKKIDFFFKNDSRFTEKLNRKHKETEFPYTFCPHTCITFSSIDNPHHHGTFVTINESTFKHYFPPKLMMYIRICSWWCVIFILPIVFSFPECHIVGIMLYYRFV